MGRAAVEPPSIDRLLNQVGEDVTERAARQITRRVNGSDTLRFIFDLFIKTFNWAPARAAVRQFAQKYSDSWIIVCAMCRI